MGILDKIKGPKGDTGPVGLPGKPGDGRASIAYTHCNLCKSLEECVRIGHHMICNQCERKMFTRLKLILDFQ